MEVADAGRFVKEEIDRGAQVGLGMHETAPAGHHDDRSCGRLAFHNMSELSAVDGRHSQVSDHGVESLIAPGRGEEGIQPGLTAVSQGHVVTFALEDFLHQFANQRFVVDEQNTECGEWIGRCGSRHGVGIGREPAGEGQADGGTAGGLTFDFEVALVALDDAIDHGEAEAGSALVFGGKERFEAASACFVVHADAVIDDFEDDGRGGLGVSGMEGEVGDATAEGDGAAVGEGIEGVEDEVGERFAQFGFIAGDFGISRIGLQVEINGEAVLLADVAPSGTGQLGDLAEQLIDIDVLERPIFAAVTVELAKSGDDMGDVIAGSFDVLEVTTGVFLEIGRGFEQEFGETGDGGEGIVDVVSDATGHLAEGAEAILAHDGFLGLAEVVVGLLQLGMELGLVSGKGDLFSKNTQEFVVTRCERSQLLAGHEQQSEAALFDTQGDGDRGAEAGIDELPERWPLCVGQVRFVEWAVIIEFWAFKSGRREVEIFGG